MANRLKQEVVEQDEPKERSRSKRSKVTWRDRWERVSSFFMDERTHKLFGLFCLMTSLFMVTSFISNLICWKEDQAIAGIDSMWELLGRNDIVVNNWLGKVGALTALALQNNGFGISAFLFPLITFLVGVRVIWGTFLLPFGKTLRFGFFSLVWLSVFLGFAFQHSSSLLVLAGGYGYQMSQVITSWVGAFGTGSLLLFSMVGFLVAAFNIPLRRMSVPEVAPLVESASISEVVVPAPRENQMTRESTRTVELELQDNMEDVPSEEELEEDEPAGIELEWDSEEEEEPEGEVLETQEIEMDAVLPEPAPVVEDGELTLEVAEVKEEEAVVDEDQELVHAQGDYDPTLDLSAYHYPTLDLLENYGDRKMEVNKDELEANKNRIVETLGHYNIGIDKIKATIGPTVTLFEIVPQAGVRISKIKNLEDDIALSLSALGIRIIAPIPGRGTIGIEVPNQKPEMVPMKNVLGSDKFVNTEMDLPIALGKTISNEVFVADLAKMPHLLMAGATGQGKSVGLNAILVSLLYKKHPAQVKFVLVDPKKVELTLFKTIERHFLAKLPNEEEAIITDTKKVISTLKWTNGMNCSKTHRCVPSRNTTPSSFPVN